MSSSPQDIWSVRLQRELLALTEGEKNSEIGILPPFVEVHNTALDIDAGRCSVSFSVTVDNVDCLKRGKNTRVSSTKVESQLDEEKIEEVKEVKEVEEIEKMKDFTDNESDRLDELQTSDRNEDDNNATISHEEDDYDKGDKEFKVQVIITLDASLHRYQGDLNVSRSYPFFKPIATLTSGASHLPKSSNIKDGQEIQIDCDWTPSLHLNDAALNIALKIRESIKRDEPCLKVLPYKDESILDEVAADLTAGATKVASFFSELRNKASAVANEIDQAVITPQSDTSRSSRVSMPNKATLKRFRRKEGAELTKKVVTVENIEISDEINLAEAPWREALGLYPCKAIRRPEFVEAMMHKTDDSKVAGAGLSGAGTMFRSFSKSAKSLLEESFLMLTEELVLEIRCNKFSVSIATVSFVIPISHLAKLKFRREESISLFFKEAVEDPIIYMCPSSADAVKNIQNILKKHGVKGKHTNAAMVKTIQIALQMLEDIKAMESKVETNPNREQVTIIMDLYRQAAEKFELAGDVRHEQVMSHMRNFLAKPYVATILDPPNVEEDTEVNKIPFQMEEGKKKVTDNEHGLTSNHILEDTKGEEGLKEAMKEAEDIIENAHNGIKQLGLDDDVGDDDDFESDKKETGDLVSNTVAELEDMLKDADKELQELMGE